MEAATDPALPLAVRPLDTDVALRMYGVRPPFVGRQPALRVLYEAARTATRTRQLQQILVSGPEGVGKSRLAHELVDLIEAGGHPITTLRAVAREGVSSGLGLIGQLVRARFHVEPGASDATVLQRLSRGLMAEAPTAEHERWVQLLGCLVGLPIPPSEPGEVRTPPETVRLHAVAAFGTLLSAEAARRPLILILDGLQWVGPAGLDMLGQLVERLSHSPTLAVLLARDASAEAALVPDASVARLPLVALRPEESMKVAAGLLGGQQVEDLLPLGPILAEAGGNPGRIARRVRGLLARGAIELEGRALTLDLREIEADLRDHGVEPPRSDRLDGLSDAEREVLESAAVFGDHFWFDGVLALLWATRPAEARDATDTDRIELALHHTLLGLLRRDVVRFFAAASADREATPSVRGTDELSFAHPEDRTRVLEGADPDRLTVLRGWAGRWMLAADAVHRQRWCIRAGHVLDESDRGDLAIEAWCRAGEEALRRGRDDVAVAAFEHVLGTTEDDDEQRARALGGLADIHERAHRFGESLDAWNRLLRWARILGDRRLAARANVAQGRLLERLGRVVEAREVLARASSRCEALGMGDDRASTEEVLARLAAAEGTSAAHLEALAHLRHALALWERLQRGDAVAGVHARCARHFLALGALGEARRAANHARRAFEAIDDPIGRARTVDLLAAGAASAGDLTGAVASWSDALSLLQAGDEPDLRAAILGNLSDAHLLLGEVERADEQAEASLALARELRSARLEAQAHHRRAAVLRHRGQLDEALTEAEAAHRLATDLGDARLAAATLRGLADVRARELARRIARAEPFGSGSIERVGSLLRDACRQSEAVGDRGGLAHALESYASWLDSVGAGHKCRKVRLRVEGLRTRLSADWDAGLSDLPAEEGPGGVELPSMDELEQVAQRTAGRRFGEPFHD